MALLSVAEALRRILDGARPTEAETVALLDAGARTLATDIKAKLTQPPFDASAMDGYGVRAADVARLPARLRLVGTSQAGRRYEGKVGAGECVRIFTGAPVPEGADAIVIQENVSAAGEWITVVDGVPDPDHIRVRGADFVEGAALLGAGRRLDARALTLAAAMGHPTLPVRRKPVVALIATGDELVLPGSQWSRDSIVCSNPFGLASIIASFGGEARFIGIAPDRQEEIEDAIGRAADADILVTTGGASVGDHDLVAPALKARGMALDFWKIAMRPGKPMLFGRLGSQRVLGFPGNPVSALICARVFLVPLLWALLGRLETDVISTHATLAVPLNANGPRQHYMRATLERQGADRPLVSPLASQDSSLMSPLASADCLIVRPPEAPPLAKGATVEILMMDF